MESFAKYEEAGHENFLPEIFGEFYFPDGSMESRKIKREKLTSVKSFCTEKILVNAVKLKIFESRTRMNLTEIQQRVPDVYEILRSVTCSRIFMALSYRRIKIYG